MRRTAASLLGALALALAGCASSTLVKYGLTQPEPAYLVARPSFQWSKGSTEHFRIYAESGTASVAGPQAYGAVLERSLTHVTKTLETGADLRPIHAFAVASPERMEALLGVRAPGRAFFGTNVFAFQPRSDWEQTARHELTHIVANNAWGRAPEDWINEGLATYVAQQISSGDIHGYFRRTVVARGEVITLREMAGRFQRNQRSEPLYVQAASVTNHLRERYGLAAVRQVWSGGLDAVPRATGKDLTAFEAEWRSVVEAAGRPRGGA